MGFANERQWKRDTVPAVERTWLSQGNPLIQCVGKRGRLDSILGEHPLLPWNIN